MKLQQFIKLHKPILINHLQDIISMNKDHTHFSIEKDALHKLEDCLFDGKLLRGLLVILSAEIHHAKLTADIYKSAAIIELLHTTLLIQDDIMDNDIKRRNKDSIFYQYVKEGRNNAATDPLLYGQSMAICLADISFFIAIKSLAQHISDPIILRNVLHTIGTELQKVAPAQMLDAIDGFTPREPTQEEIFKKYLYKTAHYSFSLPLIVGSLFSSTQSIPLLKQFGEDIGIIFQLKDDDLGIFGNEQEIGKQVGSDIRENKKTLLRWYTFKNAIGKDRQQLATIFGKSTISPEELRFVRECVEKYHGRTLINREIDKRIDRLNETIQKIEKAGISTEVLKDIVEYNLIRNK